MDIIESTQQYEAWLARYIPIIQADLDYKHQAMRESPFPFLRASYYRWAQLWPEVCPDLAEATAILCVGDLHVENLGTWRDAEGRLAWGVNDFDEAAILAYPQDLVRLAASALMGIEEHVLSIDAEEACEAIIDGYGKSLEKLGRPFILAEGHDHLREMAYAHLKDPDSFWQKLNDLSRLDQVPLQVRTLLESAMPEPGLSLRISHRIAGLGSLGRERYTAITTWQGGLIAREAKRLILSTDWLGSGAAPGPSHYQQVLGSAVRSQDPFTRQQGDWIIQRLAPDCARIELANLPKVQEEAKLLFDMGFETANVHLANGPATAGHILAGLKHLPDKWLFKAAQAMTKAALKDWDTFRKSGH
jgi:hypothetical protein